MLLPALAKARNKARSISCISTCKQIGLSIFMYAGDNNGYLPPMNYKYGVGAWMSSEDPYANKAFSKSLNQFYDGANHLSLGILIPFKYMPARRKWAQSVTVTPAEMTCPCFNFGAMPDNTSRIYYGSYNYIGGMRYTSTYINQPGQTNVVRFRTTDRPRYGSRLTILWDYCGEKSPKEYGGHYDGRYTVLDITGTATIVKHHPTLTGAQALEQY